MNCNITEPPRNQKSFLKSNDLACPTCKKCIYSANHDKCILKYLSKVNSYASAQKKDAQSYKITKRYIPVEKKSDSKNHGRQILIGQRFSSISLPHVVPENNALSSIWSYMETQRVESLLKLVSKWIPYRTGQVDTRPYNKNDSASPLGKETHNPKTIICANSSSLSASTSMASEPIFSKGLSNVQTAVLQPHSSNGDGDALFQLKSDSLPHAHAQISNTYFKHRDDSRIKKAQLTKVKDFANLINKIFI
ncbi:hypothetical protein Tco_1216162 [Tanacetum coccineum]